MSFIVRSRTAISSGIVAGLLLCLVGCGPDSSTPPSGGSKSREQVGSTTGGPKKGAEVPEPAPAKDDGDKKDEAKPTDEKPADEKAAEDKPKE